MTETINHIFMVLKQLDQFFLDIYHTNQQNILIRSLSLKKQKGDSSSKKRSANKALDDSSSAKRPANVSRQEGSSSGTGEKDFQSLIVEKLRALLKEKGLPTKGRKDELIARLKDAN
ncbi:uncharacterized protein LOC106415532 [Brassica napus]|uniref:uncharacterized protein LOC106415532 n=1 Tax=Brassica napus TaxID=3708 RepID=UPI002078B2B1|nr:uncharacterized protein LOC106415532 [Brassica napus]